MFSRQMHQQGVGRIPNIPKWPFKCQTVRFMEAYGPWNRPQNTPQCRSAMLHYFARRLTYDNLLDLQLELVRICNQRIGEIAGWVRNSGPERVPRHQGWATISLMHEAVGPLLEQMSKDVKDDRNRKLFTEEHLCAAVDMLGCLVAEAYKCDKVDSDISGLLGIKPSDIFERFMGEAQRIALACERPRGVKTGWVRKKK